MGLVDVFVWCIWVILDPFILAFEYLSWIYNVVFVLFIAFFCTMFVACPAILHCIRKYVPNDPFFVGHHNIILHNIGGRTNRVMLTFALKLSIFLFCYIKVLRSGIIDRLPMGLSATANVLVKIVGFTIWNKLRTTLKDIPAPAVSLALPMIPAPPEALVNQPSGSATAA
jgi:hypothetical protein